MDHVDQALYTRPNLSGGTERSAQKTALIGIALAALAGFVSSASAESILPTRATGLNSSCRSRRPDPSVDQFLPEPPS